MPSDAQNTAKHRALRLLARAPLPPPPAPEQLGVARVARRPGDLHEALALTDEQRGRVVAAASQAGVDFDIAASVLLEAGLAAEDVGHADVPVRPPTVGQGTAATAVYVRSITISRGRAGAAPSPRPCARIPARVVVRLAGRDLDRLLEVVDVKRALEWEAAAVAEGRTLSEWVLLRALESRA